MKNLQITLAAFMIMFTLQSNAQFSISVNLGSRPQCHDRYVNEVSYYYFPEIEAYYDVNSSVFIYYGSRGWVRTAYLPEYCRNYDINRGYKVALSYTGRTPYVNFNYDRRQYCRANDRNYRAEYYHPRNNYVEYTNYNHHDNRYFKKEKHHGNKYGNKHFAYNDCD